MPVDNHSLQVIIRRAVNGRDSREFVSRCVNCLGASEHHCQEHVFSIFTTGDKTMVDGVYVSFNDDNMVVGEFESLECNGIVLNERHEEQMTLYELCTHLGIDRKGPLVFRVRNEPRVNESELSDYEDDSDSSELSSSDSIVEEE